MVFIVYACVPNRVFAEIRYCIDPSWKFALNTAIHRQYTFGKDFVFTYGPLGFLSTGLPLYLPDHGAGIIIYKTILFLGLVWLGCYAIRTANSLWYKLMIVLVFVFAGRLYSYESSLYYLVLFVALLVWHQKKQKDYLLYIALAFAVINFYIKLNTGFVIWILLALYLGVLCFQRQISVLKLMGMGLGAVILLFVLAWLTHTNLQAYLANGWEIVRNFSAAQFFPVSINSPTFLWAMVTLLAYLFLLLFYLKSNVPQKFLLVNCIMLAICLFVAFKQGFVRGSYNHQVSFFCTALILLPVFFSLMRPPASNATYNIPAVIILFFCGISIIQVGIYGFGFSPLKDLYTESQDPIDVMPAKIINRIGNAGIDIFPYESMHLFYNKLNYAPRPVPQGYQAYSDKLDSMNSMYFQNGAAPEFILFANGSIDERHPFWDEIKTKFAVRLNYEIQDSLHLKDKPNATPVLYWLLKKKKDITKSSCFPKGPSWTQLITDSIDCSQYPEDRLLKIDIRPSLPGVLRSFFFQPAKLNCHVQYMNGAEKMYPAIAPLFSGGIPVGYKLETDEDIARFLRGVQPAADSKMQKIWFTGDLNMFNERLSLQIVSVSISK